MFDTLTEQQIMDFNMEQDETLMNCNVSINRPVIILKDRNYLGDALELDLGEIQVT